VLTSVWDKVKVKELAVKDKKEKAYPGTEVVQLAAYNCKY